MSAERSDAGHVRLPFLPGIEGLRGLAVGVVLLFHADFAFAKGGFLGVSSFFTLSGFLITALLVAEHERNAGISLGAFYARRVRRILPASLLALLLILLFGVFAADDAQLARLRGDVLSALFYCANWWLMLSGGEYASQLGSPSPVQHFWSLAIEEQFYFVYPLLVLVCFGVLGFTRRRLAALLGLAIFSCWAWGAWLEAGMASSSRLYYGTDTRSAELFTGALLGALWNFDRKPGSGVRRDMIAWAGVVGLVVSGIFWLTSSPHDFFLYRGGLAIYSLSTVAILASVLISGGPVQGLLSLAPLRWLGRISYGAYLYHWPIFLWLTPESTGWGVVPLSVVRIALTLLVSELSYRCVEQPVRSREWPLGLAARIAPFAAILAIAGGGFFLTRDIADPWPELDLRERAIARSAGDGRIRVAVFGDSVALKIGEALERWGDATGQIEVLTTARRGCGVGRGGRTEKTAETIARICDIWDERWGRPMAAFQPDVILLVSTGWDLKPRFLADGKKHLIGEPVYDAWLRSEFEAAAGFLTAEGASLALLTSPCVRPGKMGAVGVFDPKRIDALNEGILRPLARATGPEIALIDLFEHVCPNGAYANTLGGITPARPDGIHFSDAGADWLVEWLGPQVVALGKAEKR